MSNISWLEHLIGPQKQFTSVSLCYKEQLNGKSVWGPYPSRFNHWVEKYLIIKWSCPTLKPLSFY